MNHWTIMYEPFLRDMPERGADGTYQASKLELTLLALLGFGPPILNHPLRRVPELGTLTCEDAHASCYSRADRPRPEEG